MEFNFRFPTTLKNEIRSFNFNFRFHAFRKPNSNIRFRFLVLHFPMRLKNGIRTSILCFGFVSLTFLIFSNRKNVSTSCRHGMALKGLDVGGVEKALGTRTKWRILVCTKICSILNSLCVRSVEKEEFFLYSIAALILKHEESLGCFNIVFNISNF